MEHGTIIFVVCFVGVFIFLAGLIPNSLLVNSVNPYEGQFSENIDYPDAFDISAIGAGNIINGTQDQENITLNTFYYMDLGTEKIRILWETEVTFGQSIFIDHDHAWYVFPWWEKTNLYPVNKDYVLSIQSNNVSSLNCICSKGDFSCLLQITFDNSTYSSMLQAWNAGHLKLFGGIRSTDTQTEAHFDAWNLIGQLLWFQSKSIGIDPLINYLIALPIWISIAIGILYILDKILPF